jgi:hypothetical protein
MSDTYITTTSAGYDIYKDSHGQCYLFDPFNGIELYDVPCPGATTTPQVPPITGGGVSTGGVLIQSGHSWYEDLLNTLLGLGAIGQGAAYIPSTAMPPKPAYIPAPIQPNSGNIAGNNNNGVAEDLGAVIKKNAIWFLVGGVVYVLFKSGRSK